MEERAFVSFAVIHGSVGISVTTSHCQWLYLTLAWIFPCSTLPSRVAASTFSLAARNLTIVSRQYEEMDCNTAPRASSERQSLASRRRRGGGTTTCLRMCIRGFRTQLSGYMIFEYFPLVNIREKFH
jgi:hypothetical protein